MIDVDMNRLSGGIGVLDRRALFLRAGWPRFFNADFNDRSVSMSNPGKLFNFCSGL